MPAQEIDVRQVPRPERHPRIFARFADLEPGESFVLINGHDPKHLRREFDTDHRGVYGWEYLEGGPGIWRIRISRLTPTLTVCDATALDTEEGTLMRKFSLDALARRQLERAADAPAGHAAETVIGGHEHVLRQTVVALIGGSELKEHESPGEATVHVLSGRVRLVSGDNSWEGRTGDLLVVPEARHSLEAIEDSAVLLSVAKPS
ncbi:DUF2249 domain-containing protein [Sphaerisporangium perillae]|uniref:DUF2249 domain-containing protein n=1 Tax=Sphaerisporangium perillae TaxID=2935860 RepID=UPI00200F57A0|nr:DUF2249 domain-containing protein [Sphaerisporangium perillae]